MTNSILTDINISYNSTSFCILNSYLIYLYTYQFDLSTGVPINATYCNLRGLNELISV